MAVLYLEGCPLQWYHWMVRSKGRPLIWVEFERGLISMYDLSSTVDYADALAKLKQDNYDYDEYQSEFIRLSHHVHGLLEEFLASCFLSELEGSC